MHVAHQALAFLGRGALLVKYAEALVAPGQLALTLAYPRDQFAIERFVLLQHADKAAYQQDRHRKQE